MWCSICNRYTDDRCQNCSEFRKNKNDICIGGNCMGCEHYNLCSDLCNQAILESIDQGKRGKKNGNQ